MAKQLSLFSLPKTSQGTRLPNLRSALDCEDEERWNSGPETNNRGWVPGRVPSDLSRVYWSTLFQGFFDSSSEECIAEKQLQEALSREIKSHSPTSRHAQPQQKFAAVGQCSRY